MFAKEAEKTSNKELAEIVEACCKGYWENFGKEAANRLRKLDDFERGGAR